MSKKSNTEKIILGIDPGTNVMGYGVIRIIGNKAELVVMGVIDMRKESDPYLRLGKIFDRVTGIIDSYLLLCRLRLSRRIPPVLCRRTDTNKT